MLKIFYMKGKQSFAVHILGGIQTMNLSLSPFLPPPQL